MNEEGLYDYVVFNNELEDALAQLRDIADQALAGLSGQGAKLSKARAAADATAASPKVCIDCLSTTPLACFPSQHQTPTFSPSVEEQMWMVDCQEGGLREDGIVVTKGPMCDLILRENCINGPVPRQCTCWNNSRSITGQLLCAGFSLLMMYCGAQKV